MGFPGVWFAVVFGLSGVLIVLVLVALLIMLLAWRRLRDLRVGGIEVALRTRRDDRGRGWHLGMAHYRGEECAWYRVLSLRSGPSRVLNRSELEIRARREPSVAESYMVPAGSTVLTLAYLEQELELAMGPDALTGFLSWLESAPPGSSVPRAS